MERLYTMGTLRSLQGYVRMTGEGRMEVRCVGVGIRDKGQS